MDELIPNPDWLKHPNLREARLYSRSGDRVECLTCERRCKIPEGGLGFCRTRANIQGKLYTLVYGDLNAISVNPIEKKPLFHYYPGSRALTFSTWSCNFSCPWCQNFHLSKQFPDPSNANYISPQDVIRLALSEGCHGISVSFTEPLMLFEYSLDVFPLARSRGLYAHYISNGYMSAQALRLLRDAGMDCLKVDIKGDREAVRRYCGADVDICWRNARLAKQLGMHVEIVNLVIPGVNDHEQCLREIASRVVRDLGPETPVHFTRFHPDYKMMDRNPTPISTLERAHGIARSEGCLFAYIGNVPGHPYENTYCPECNQMLIKRYGLRILRYELTRDHRCPKCGTRIPILGEPAI